MPKPLTAFVHEMMSGAKLRTTELNANAPARGAAPTSYSLRVFLRGIDSDRHGLLSQHPAINRIFEHHGITVKFFRQPEGRELLSIVEFNAAPTQHQLLKDIRASLDPRYRHD